jgi:hypothetical protein
MSTITYVCNSAEKFARTVNVRLQCCQIPSGYGDIEITDLYADVPGEGTGTIALQNLCDLADEYGFNIHLHPESPRNKDFYARFGFVREKNPRYPYLQLTRFAK